MGTLPLFLVKILQTLAGKYAMGCTLEELTSLLTPTFNDAETILYNRATEVENQAKVLEALLVLNEQGYIFLNTVTDKSSITIKGLMKVNNKVFCN